VRCQGLGDQIWFLSASTKFGMLYPYTPEMVMGCDGVGVGGNGGPKFGFPAHLNQIWHVITLHPREGLRVWDGVGETKFGFSAHLNQLWYVISLHPRDGHGGRCGGWGWRMGDKFGLSVHLNQI